LSKEMLNISGQVFGEPIAKPALMAGYLFSVDKQFHVLTYKSFR
jgi:hypothetical protein